MPGAYLSPTPEAEAQGGGGAVVLSTTLLTVEPRQRTATISVANRTATPQRYRISVVDMVAKEPPASIAGGLEETQQDGGMQINIVTVYSTSIPIVFKQGRLAVSASMSEARLVDSNSLSLTVERQGNASFRGFARATVGDAAPINLPITIYPERDEVTRTYGLDTLADATGPLTLTLHEGLVPRESEEFTSLALGHQGGADVTWMTIRIHGHMPDSRVV